MFHVAFFFSSLYRFTPLELALFAEYAKTVSPVAKAQDVREKPVCRWYGWSPP